MWIKGSKMKEKMPQCSEEEKRGVMFLAAFYTYFNKSQKEQHAAMKRWVILMEHFICRFGVYIDNINNKIIIGVFI